MIHTCNIHCHAMDLDRADLMGIEDKGKWLSFAFHMDIVIACKLTSDDDEETVHGCTTVFTEQGDSYIIDTPYEQFITLFQMYNTPTAHADEKGNLDFN